MLALSKLRIDSSMDQALIYPQIKFTAVKVPNRGTTVLSVVKANTLDRLIPRPNPIKLVNVYCETAFAAISPILSF